LHLINSRLAKFGSIFNANQQRWHLSVPVVVLAGICRVAVLIADAGYELYAACETVRELDLLYSDLGLENEMPELTV
jgi:hypothetical protein